MKIWKRFAAGLLTAALTLSLLTACGDSGGGSNGGGNSGNANPPAASTGGQDNESSSDSTIQEPDKTLTWANSKTNAYFSRLGVTREIFMPNWKVSRADETLHSVLAHVEIALVIRS